MTAEPSGTLGSPSLSLGKSSRLHMLFGYPSRGGLKDGLGLQNNIIMNLFHKYKIHNCLLYFQSGASYFGLSHGSSVRPTVSMRGCRLGIAGGGGTQPLGGTHPQAISLGRLVNPSGYSLVGRLILWKGSEEIANFFND
jgi:hypothetical protein